MTEYNKKLYYRKGNETKSIKLYTTTTEAGDERFAVRDGNNTVYAKVGEEDDGRASDVRVIVRGGYGPTYAIYTTAGPREAETLIRGNINEGYFGTISSGAMNYIEPWKLLNAVWNVGASHRIELSSLWNSKGDGSLWIGMDKNIYLGVPWMKFALNGKILLVSQKPLVSGISWDQINAKGAVFGKNINIGGVNYKCRLFRGANTDPVTGEGTARFDQSEWNRLMYKVAATSAQGTADWAAFTASELGLDNSGRITWCQEAYNNNGTLHPICRGNSGAVGSYQSNSPVAAWGELGFRPVLELITE